MSRTGGDRLVRLYYGFQFFFSLLLWIPIFYEYQRRVGLSDRQIFGIQALYYMAFCFLELPTGALADLWGKRACLRLGAGILVIANVLPLLASARSGAYPVFCAHFLLIALARSLASGAASAYLYQGLLAQGEESSRYKSVEGKARAFGLFGKMALWPGVGALMQWKLGAPYLLTAIAAAVSVVFAFLLPPEPDRGPARSVPGGMGRITRILAELGPVLRGLRRSPVLGLIMLQGVAIFVLSRVLQTNLFQPLLGLKGFRVTFYGAVMAAMTASEALGAGYPLFRGLLRALSDLSSISILTAIIALSLAVISFAGPAGTIVGLLIFSGAAGMAFPLQRQLLNDAITSSGKASNYRATLLSVESILDRAVCAWAVSWLGLFVASGRIPEFLELAAGASGAGILILYILIGKVFDKPLGIIYPAKNDL